MSQTIKLMLQALELATLAGESREVPVGAIVTDAFGEIIGKGYNLTRANADPTAHAEIVAIREACRKLESARLDGCNLYVTLEPCAMCAAAIANARIRNLYFAAYDPKQGAVAHGVRYFDSKNCLHCPNVHDGILMAEASKQLRSFFASLR